MQRHWSTPVLLAAAVSLSTACSETRLECAAGEVLAGKRCATVCDSDDQCIGGTPSYCDDSGVCLDGARPAGCTDTQCVADFGAGYICGAENQCIQGVRSDPPSISDVDGTGSVDGLSAHAAHRFQSTLIITGEHLEGTSASLIGQNGAQNFENLSPAGPSDEFTLTVALPSALVQGDYLLQVTNQVGSAQTAVMILQGEKGDAGSAGAPGTDGAPGVQGPAGPTNDRNAVCTTPENGPGVVFNNVCVLAYDNTNSSIWNTAASTCVAKGGDLCSTSQYYAFHHSLNGTNQLFYNQKNTWSRDFSDNDCPSGQCRKSFVLHSSDDPQIDQAVSYACCSNLVPEPFRSQSTTIRSVSTTFVHKVEDTTWTTAADICHNRGADLCTKSQYVALIDDGTFSAGTRLWTDEMSDNDGNQFDSIIGPVGDSPSWANLWAYACCGSNRPLDNSCPAPGQLLLNGLCAMEIHDTEDTTFIDAARACTTIGADICSKSQMQAMRNAGEFFGATWTNDGADNDSNRAGGLIGDQARQPDNPILTPPGSETLMGYACCL